MSWSKEDSRNLQKIADILEAFLKRKTVEEKVSFTGDNSSDIK
jgi:hypothetical protein